MPRSPRPLAVDLFCGVGGMSLGFEQAGFNVAAAFDAEQWNVHSYNKNFPGSTAHVADLSKVSGKEIRRIAGISNRSIDVLFGGPPCQGFSVGGKRDLTDKRNSLVYEFARLTRQLRPRYFVMENVAGLLHGHSRPVLDSFLRRVRLAGYTVVEPIQILNAADFGVPQRRKRAFIIGCRQRQPVLDYPEPRGCVDESGKEFFPKVRDAIWDLMQIENRCELFDNDMHVGKIIARGRYARMLRCEYRSKGDRSKRRAWDRNCLTACLKTRHESRIAKRFEKTPPGRPEPISRYHRLDLHDVAPTIRAGTGSDHGSHTAPRPIHPTVPRCITAREAARLHSFPDWFRFHGTRWHDFRQIGNSVPPLLARAVATQVLRALTG